MNSVIRLRMRAPADRIFALAADVERWPALLPHYRYVRPVNNGATDGGREFAMGARRGVVPVRWQATQRPLPAERVIEFTHTGGVTRGMQVAWRLLPVEGGTHVRIEHSLDLRWPVIGRVAADWVIGPHFIEPIAARTLARMKQLAETDR
jgi:ribosome-associated toxin RatA of RatAB toxin-antitoxin module